LNSSRRVRPLIFALMFATGCVIFEDDAYFDDPPIVLTTHVSAGGSPAFARIDAFLTRIPPPSFVEGDEPVQTPAMIEDGLLPSAKTAIGRTWHRNLWAGPATTQTAFTSEWSFYDDVVLKRGIILVGFASDGAREIVTGGVLATPRFFEDRGPELDVTLFATGAPEVWGQPPHPSATDHSKQCLRRTSGDRTLYLVRVDDTDCDGFLDADDCQPRVYCDPASGSERGKAACRCDPSFARPWQTLD
jgi:hypothetical protein